MSPIFGYVMLFMVWASLAVLMWSVAALLLIRRRTRRIGRCLFWAMAGTLPGVLVLQIAAAPVMVAVLAIAGLFWRIVEPGPQTTTSSSVVGAVSMIVALFVICFLAVMSLIGFYEGWRIGWAYGSGAQPRSIAESFAPIRWFRLLRGRVRARA